ncbi:GNAT family N-acetyltransferase [Actinopolymorpha sp. B11F2]|uniref:GNAT family N-acetyltransferase n=1 Tax=Actinopolymorpha sp. B11F2 TaxID=3160862 RepID=UPI0032E40D6E
MSARTPDRVPPRDDVPSSGGTPRTGLVVREARRADLATIVALIAADAIREVRETVPAGASGEPSEPAGLRHDVADDGLEPGYVAAFDEIAADPNTLLLVGELPAGRGAEVVATCQLTFLRHLMYHGGVVAQVEAVRTAAHLRGHGIGTALMDWVVAESRRRGAVRLQLTSNRARGDAHRFYERLGFKASHVGMKLYLGTDAAGAAG